MRLDYIGIPQKTAAWLVADGSICLQLAKALQSDGVQVLEAYDFVEGPIRMSYDEPAGLLLIWNIDYQTSYGESAFGFIRIAEPFGAFTCSKSTPLNTFSRQTYVVNQRLLNRLFMAADFYRNMPNGGAKVDAPHASDGTNLGFGLVEDNIAVDSGRQIKTVLCVGPEHDFTAVSQAAVNHRHELGPLVNAALQILNRRHEKPVAGSGSLADFRDAISPERRSPQATERLLAVTQRLPTWQSSEAARYRALSFSYDDWLLESSTLSQEQRRVVERDIVLDRPVRIIGPGGSGKTLVMQLLAMRILRGPGRRSVLYVTHNDAIRQLVWERFGVLGAHDENLHGQLTVSTLANYAKEQLSLGSHRVFNADAEKAKDEQLEEVREAVVGTIKDRPDLIPGTGTLSELVRGELPIDVLVELVRADISIAIKARDLTHDEQEYITSAEPLGPLHRLLSPDERKFVFAVFTRYQTTIEAYEVLDTDDIALSMLGILRTPRWNIDRRTRGFDYAFVDEAQLFNENERRLFGLLTKSNTPYTPVVLALDEAQQVHSQKTSGLAIVGLTNVERTRLSDGHRMAPPIARLAFYIISQSVGLFDDDFPDFTADLAAPEEGTEEHSSAPELLRASPEGGLRGILIDKIRSFRKLQLKTILVVCHARRYWTEVEAAIRSVSDKDFKVLSERGDPATNASLVLASAEVIGGQEFDAVISIGLEEGVVPPRVKDNAPLEDLLEQDVIREIYLTFTRARFGLAVLVNNHARPNAVLQRAILATFLRDTAR